MKTAPLGIRVLAAVLDSILVSVAWYYIIQVWGQSGSAPGNTSATMGGDKTLAGIPALLLMLATAAYWIVPEWIIGQTLGKLIFGLRVTSLDGAAMSFGQSVKRNVLRIIDFFPFYLTGFLAALLTPNRQRLGDMWARTVVVRKSELQTRVESPQTVPRRPETIGL